MAVRSPNYYEEQKQKYTLRLRNLIKDLPPFINEFFKGINHTRSVKTRLAYAYDLKVFFEYVVEKSLLNKKMNDLTFEDLDFIKSEDLEDYLDYLTYYTKKFPNGSIVEYQNQEYGKARKLSTIKAMYNYFYRKRKVNYNPSKLVDMPKVRQKSIVRLEPNEIYDLLDEIESGAHLTKKQKYYHNHTKLRDTALISLLLGTGMRVSECVGININDLDFNINGIRITRKGGDESIIYFGEEVSCALNSYLEERKDKGESIQANAPLFLSMQKNRMNVRTVQKLVKKYTSIITKIKDISPHKLRSTYGTNLYRATGDIYLVADVLGHQDVNTTRRHYAQLDDERRRTAANIVKLRKKEQ